MSNSCTVSSAQIERYNKDGIVPLRGLFADWIDVLREGVERNMGDPGPWSKQYTPDGNPGGFFGDYCNWQRIPQYRRFVTESPVGEIAAQLMQSKSARFFHEHVLVKEPGTAEPTPWHHDQPYYSIDGRQNVSLWIPLDPVASDVCPEFIMGSHAWGKWFVPTRFTGQSWDRQKEQEKGLEFIPDIDAERDKHEIVSWDLEPGDALAFNFLTVHGAPPNSSNVHRRRGFSARLIGDDARWATRSGPTSPPFPHLHERLQHGAELEGVDEFPLVYPLQG